MQENARCLSYLCYALHSRRDCWSDSDIIKPKKTKKTMLYLSIKNQTQSSHQEHDDTTIIDSLTVMMEQECSTYACQDYIDSSQETRCCNDDDNSCATIPGVRISSDDRMKVVDWCYDIVDMAKLDRDNVAVALNVADRFMSSKVSPVKDILHHRGQYQLLIIASLYIAIKMNEHVTFSSDALADSSCGTYSTEMIEFMELTILHGLDWRVNVPTPQAIGSHMLKLLKQKVEVHQGQQQDDDDVVSQDTWNFIRDEMTFQVQNAVREYYFVTHRSSTIAAVAILNAIEQVDDIDYEILMKTMISILKQFDFVDANVLLETRHILKVFIDEDDELTVPHTYEPDLEDEEQEDNEEEDEICSHFKRQETDETMACSVSSILTRSPRRSMAAHTGGDETSET